MDINKYLDKKEKGLVEVTKFGSMITIVSKTFDPDTGEQLDDEIIPQNREALEGQKAMLEKQLTTINSLLADIDQVDQPVKSKK